METVSYRQFWREVTKDGRAPCALAGVVCHRCEGSGRSVKFEGACLLCRGTGRTSCSGRMDAHHFVPKRRLRTAAAKTDVRNGICLCRAHHDWVEQGQLLSPRPALLAFFLAEHDVPEHNVPKSGDRPPVLQVA